MIPHSDAMTTLFKRLRKIWDYGSGRTVLAAVSVHSVSISIGICQGYSAIVIPQLNGSQQFRMDAEQSSWIASLGAVTNPLGSILSGLLAEYLGRKFSIQFSSLPFIFGWLCIAFAQDISWLYAGRLITGIAAGMSPACYTYVSEISTPEQRGFLQALGPVSASFGILLTYTLGAFIDWKTLALISVIFSLFTIVSVYYLPESPSYLFKKEMRKEAFESLMWLKRSNGLAQVEYQRHLLANEEIQSSGGAGCGAYLKLSTAKPFFILIVLFLLQELSGIYSILFYAVNFFQEASMDVDEYVSSIIVGVIRFVMSIIGAFMINKYARKTLCMFSSAGMFLSLFVIIFYVKYYDFHPEETKVFTTLPLICVLLNVLFSMIGMLPIPWILCSELFSVKVRPIMSGIVICMAQSFIFVCVKIYPDMIVYLSFSGTLAVFAFAALLALVFCKFYLPETKNKSLEEIEDYFKTKKKVGLENPAYSGDERKPSVFTLQIKS